MARPRKCRRIRNNPRVTYFKPQGISVRKPGEVCLTHEGHEAIRLADLQGMNQEEAALLMGVSRHTFGRVLAEARRVVAEALIEGLTLRIQGGDYIIAGCCNGVVERPGCRWKGAFSKDQLKWKRATSEEMTMSKIAITSEGPTLDDKVDPRFGRAAGFVVVDLETMETRYIDNGQSQVLAQGAGIQAAQLIARSGVDCLLTGYVGPKAFQALTAAGIKIGQNLEGLTVRQAVERFQRGEVEMAEQANREGGR
ncbi:DUF134 domain-containing protein [Desulfoferrobacter suflitae]|uniref:DUF134 domain-containing protein n=1 Tax=Desulfoferrobacter suflitae TaxID=2865782 RepID=UPI002164C622|nr:DUF134 domain-containing protein [Desulfoferrobacter suflitae]MCK8603636.1 DUF134 domain-containing protein [Desulfoferrobacter suflitae]